MTPFSRLRGRRRRRFSRGACVGRRGLGALVTLALGGLATSWAAGLVAQAPPETFDLILRGGTVVDGEGRPPYRADVAIAGAYIARVGALDAARAAVEIDATGLYVAPGFINIHSHAEAEALPTAVNMLTQGVTTEILNPDGAGPLDLAAQRAELERSGLALNVGAYIGFNSAWASVVGPSERRPTPDEITRMREIVVRGLDAGAWGVSAGLDYKPAYFATVDEVVQVVEAARDRRTNFTNHDRLTPETAFSSRAGVAETVTIGDRAGLVPVATHMKIQGREQGTAAAVLGLLSEATARGRYAAGDAYPYLAGQSGLGALIIPGWAQDGGRERMLQRFADPATRARIVTEAEEAMQARFGGPSGVFLFESQRELTDVMRELGVGAGEAVLRLLEQAPVGAILRFGAEADLVQVLQHPSMSMACDCSASLATRTHPRFYGSFPRVLGHYVRDTKALPWADAVRKMTALPAATIGLVDRGVVAPGMAADLTVFDPATVIDRATYLEPTLPSVGIRHVVINGALALRDGAPTGARAGRALARGSHMPSRATSAQAMRVMALRGTVPHDASHTADRPLQVDIDVSAGATTGAPRGTVTFTGGAPQAQVQFTRIGALQVARGWAAVVGRGRTGLDDVERALTVIVEARDDALEGAPASVTLSVDGVPRRTLPVPARARIAQRTR